MVMNIPDNNRDDFSTMQRNRSSSPFDYEASFIRISSPEAEEHSPESCASSTEQFIPLVPFTFFLPQDCMSPTTFQFPQIASPKEESPPAVPSDRDLAEAMGYQKTSIDARSARLIRADALTYIEKLTLGEPKTKRPRELRSGEVRRILQDTIPRKFFVTCGLQQEKCTEQSWICDDNTLSKAAAKYITMLHQMRETKERARIDISKALAIRSNRKKQAKTGEQVVERTLDKLEAWCNDWLDGRIAEEDWDKLRDGL